MSNAPQKSAWGVPAAGAPKKNTNKKTKPEAKNVKTTINGDKGKEHLAKFKDAQKAHIAAAQKHYENYESSSEEELENTSLLESVFKSYGGEKNQLLKTEKFLENVFQSGASICLICIATIKRTAYVSPGVELFQEHTINFIRFCIV